MKISWGPFPTAGFIRKNTFMFSRRWTNARSMHAPYPSIPLSTTLKIKDIHRNMGAFMAKHGID